MAKRPMLEIRSVLDQQVSKRHSQIRHYRLRVVYALQAMFEDFLDDRCLITFTIDALTQPKAAGVSVGII